MSRKDTSARGEWQAPAAMPRHGKRLCYPCRKNKEFNMTSEPKERLYRVTFRREDGREYMIIVSASVWARAARKACDILKEEKADASQFRLVLLKEVAQ